MKILSSYFILLVGSKYERIPDGSTDRYTQWANNLTKEQLYTQVNLAVCVWNNVFN